MKKFVFASDSFKGSLSSGKIAELLEEKAEKWFPGCQCVKLCAADGGEGTLEAVLQEGHGELRTQTVSDPLGREVLAGYAVMKETGAFIEMAAASGLPLLSEAERNPMETGSFGTGQLILAALEGGCRKITIAIGGSATNDGGMGAMRALGIRFLDSAGVELEGVGRELGQVARIDTSSLSPLAKKAAFTVMCDVNNPLTGENGAAYTFGRQKGGDDGSLRCLEAGMQHYEKLLRAQPGGNACSRPGAGAAGGLGAALAVFLNAQMKPGIEAVLDMIRFDEKVKGADLVVTGEGRIDWQSSFGKVPSGVGEHCKELGIPAVAIVGGIGEGAGEIYQHGIHCIIPVTDKAMPLEEAIKRAEELYAAAADRLFCLLKLGTDIKT